MCQVTQAHLGRGRHPLLHWRRLRHGDKLNAWLVLGCSTFKSTVSAGKMAAIPYGPGAPEADLGSGTQCKGYILEVTGQL